MDDNLDGQRWFVSIERTYRIRLYAGTGKGTGT